MQDWNSRRRRVVSVARACGWNCQAPAVQRFPTRARVIVECQVAHT
jgi:hypothetical protein